MKKLCLNFACLSLMLIATAVQAADVVLVVGKHSPIESLSRSEIEDIFQGKIASLPKVGKITPLDRGEDSLREQFYATYTGKTLSQVKAYWARIIFTGRGYPPKTVGLEELKAALRSNPGAIGYMTADNVDGTLRTIRLN